MAAASYLDPPQRLQEHIAAFGTAPDGRLFPGERAGELPKLTDMRAWRAARRLAFTPEVAAGPLAATPYALRHACVSTWLSGGVPPAQVADWAGHSVEILLKVVRHLARRPRRGGPRRVGRRYPLFTAGRSPTTRAPRTDTAVFQFPYGGRQVPRYASSRANLPSIRSW